MSQKTIALYLKNIIFGGIFLSLLTPLIFARYLYFPFNSPRALFFMAIAQVIFFAWLILITFNCKYRPQLNPVTIFLTLFIGSLALSTVFSVDFINNFWSNQERSMGLLMHLHLYGFFLVVSSVLKSEKEWVRVFGFSSLVAAIVSLVSIIDNFNIVSFGISFSGGSLLGNTSFMGSYLLVNVFLSFYVFMRTWGAERIFYATSFFIITLGVVLNPGGRAMKGALLIAIIVFVLFYLAFVYRERIIRNLSRVAILLGLIAFMFIGLMTLQEGSIVQQRVMDFHGMTGRFAVWEKAQEGLKERPFLGWGPESYEIVFLKNFNPKMHLESHGREVWFDRAHNVVFDTLASGGLFGFFFFFGSFFSALFVLWKKYIKEQEIDFLAPLVFSCLFIAHFIQNLTVFDMISSYMLVFLSFAFIASFCYKEKDQKVEKKFNYLPFLVLVLFFFCFVNFVVQPLQTSFLIGKSLDIRETTQEKINYSEKALNTSLFGVRQIRRHLVERFLFRHSKEIEAIDSEKKLEEKKELINEKFFFIKNELEKNIQESPHNFKDFFLIGRLHNDYFDFYYLDSLLEIYTERKDNLTEEDKELFKEAKDWVNESKDYFEKGISLSPLNQQGYWHYTQAIINEGKIKILEKEEEKSKEKFKEALEVAKKAIEIEPRLRDSHIVAIRVANNLLEDEETTKELRESMLEIEFLNN